MTTRAQQLIDAAVKTCSSQAELARRLKVPRSEITDWKAGRRHVPDKHVLAMARLAGLNPISVAVEVYKERLGELAKTLAIGAGAIMLTFGTKGADAAPAGAPFSEHYV